MGETNKLGDFEATTLMAILRLGEDAYGMRIRQTVEERTGRHTSIGAIYTTLDRMEEKGYVSSRQGEATPERGGRAKKYFKIEGAGEQALSRYLETIRAQMLEGQQLGLLKGGLV